MIIGDGTTQLERLEYHLILKHSAAPAWTNTKHTALDSVDVGAIFIGYTSHSFIVLLYENVLKDTTRYNTIRIVFEVFIYS